MMATCEEFEERLWEAAQGGTVPPALAEHLRTCAACRGAMGALAQAAEGFATLRAVDTPEVRAAVWSRVKQPRWRMKPVLIGVAAMAACAIIGLLCLPRPSHTPVIPEPQQTADQHADTVTTDHAQIVPPPSTVIPAHTTNVAQAPKGHRSIRTVYHTQHKKDLPPPTMVSAPETLDIAPVLAAATAPSSTNTYCTRLNTFVSRTLGDTLIKEYLPNEQKAS